MQMIEQFRHFDAKQGVRDGCKIRFERIALPDLNADKPDLMDDGFWPSMEPEDAGYVLPENFEAEDQKARERMAAWKRGDWEYVGIVARAYISIVRNGHGTAYTLDSPGLWGIESDSGDDYLNEVYRDQREELLSDILEMAKFEVVAT